MRFPGLETHLWNLSRVGVASTVLAACGPMVIVGGETEGSTDDDPSVTTDASPQTSPGPDTTPAPQCESIVDCPSGFDCFNGVCQPYESDYGDTCSDDPCCSYGYGCDTDGDTDGDTDSLECYSHLDCGDARACNADGLCQAGISLPACAELPMLVPLALPTSGADLVSLAFVDADANPWQDLVVGRDGSAELWLGPGDAPPIPLPVPMGSRVIDAAAGDFDGDGQADLVLSTEQGAVLVLVADGAGGYVQVTTVQEPGAVLDLAPLHFNLDGMLDLALRVEGGEARVYWGDGAGGFSEMYTLSTVRRALSLTLSDFEGDDDDDVLVQDQVGAKRFEGSNSGNLLDDGQLPGGFAPRGLLSGNIGPAPRHDVVGYVIGPETTLLELWPDALESPQYYGVPGARLWAGMGDVQSDGVPDVVLAGRASIDYVQGDVSAGTPLLGCVASIEYPSTAVAMAVGDFDGNLQADVALGGAEGITVLLTQ